MTASTVAELGRDASFDDLATVRLWRDEELVEMHYEEPKPAPGALVIRIERSSRRRRVGASAFALAGLGLALVGSIAVRSTSSSRRGVSSAVPRIAHPRTSDRGSNAPRAAEGRSRSRPRGRHYGGDTMRRPHAGAGAIEVRRPSSAGRRAGPPGVEYTTRRRPALRPSPAPQRRGEEFGFER